MIFNYPCTSYIKQMLILPLLNDQSPENPKAMHFNHKDLFLSFLGRWKMSESVK